MKDKYLSRAKATFYTLIGIFVLIVCFFLAQEIESLERVLFPFAAVLAVLFLLLGIALIFLALKSKVKKKLKVFFILTGASAAGFLVSVVLHNLLYGLGVLLSSFPVLSYLMEILHVIFFLIGVIGCPVVFLVGMIGTIIILAKKSY